MTVLVNLALRIKFLHWQWTSYRKRISRVVLTSLMILKMLVQAEVGQNKNSITGHRKTQGKRLEVAHLLLQISTIQVQWTSTWKSKSKWWVREFNQSLPHKLLKETPVNLQINMMKILNQFLAVRAHSLRHLHQLLNNHHLYLKSHSLSITSQLMNTRVQFKNTSRKKMQEFKLMKENTRTCNLGKLSHLPTKNGHWPKISRMRKMWWETLNPKLLSTVKRCTMQSLHWKRRMLNSRQWEGTH